MRRLIPSETDASAIATIALSAVLHVTLVAVALAGAWGSVEVAPAEMAPEALARFEIKPVVFQTLALPSATTPEPEAVAPAEIAPEPEPLRQPSPPSEAPEEPEPIEAPAPEIAQAKAIVAAPAEIEPEAPTVHEIVQAEPEPIARAVAAANTSKPIAAAAPSDATRAPEARAQPRAFVGLQGPERAGLIKSYRAKLFRFVDARATIPRAARRARMQGTVYLSVVIDARGRVMRVRVKKSSGHALLDRSARQMVLDMKSLIAPPAALGWNKKRLTIPIHYKM